MAAVIDRMTQDEFEVLVTQSMERMSRSIAECNLEWDLPSYRQWSLQGAKLTLFDGPSPPIRCQVQVVGEYRSDTSIWRWSWCFTDFRSQEIRDLALVKAFGHQHRITDITLNSMVGGEATGWELAAVAANLLKATSVYAVVDGSRMLFLLIKSVQFASAIDSGDGQPRPPGTSPLESRKGGSDALQQPKQPQHANRADHEAGLQDSQLEPL